MHFKEESKTMKMNNKRAAQFEDNEERRSWFFSVDPSSLERGLRHGGFIKTSVSNDKTDKGREGSQINAPTNIMMYGGIFILWLLWE